MATSACAVVSDPSQVPQLCTGDQRISGRTHLPAIEAVGSKAKHSPTSERVDTVASSTSGFVDVDTTALPAARTLGMTIEVVFPERGGPSTMTECSAAVKHQPRRSCPR